MGKQNDTPSVDNRSEQERYAEIVADVKAQAREQTPKRGGAWTTWEIQRRWALVNGRKFDLPEPGGEGGVGSTAMSPPAESRVGPVKAVDETGGKKPATPKEDKGKL